MKQVLWVPALAFLLAAYLLEVPAIGSCNNTQLVADNCVPDENCTNTSQNCTPNPPDPTRTYKKWKQCTDQIGTKCLGTDIDCDCTDVLTLKKCGYWFSCTLQGSTGYCDDGVLYDECGDVQMDHATGCNAGVGCD